MAQISNEILFAQLKQCTSQFVSHPTRKNILLLDKLIQEDVYPEAFLKSLEGYLLYPLKMMMQESLPSLSKLSDMR